MKNAPGNPGAVFIPNVFLTLKAVGIEKQQNTSALLRE